MPAIACQTSSLNPLADATILRRISNVYSRSTKRATDAANSCCSSLVSKFMPRRADRKRCRERFEITLHVEQVDTARTRAPLFGLARSEREAADAQRLREPVAREHAADLEYANARQLAFQVGLQHADEPGQQRRSHHIEMRGDRVQHGDGLARRVERQLVTRSDKAERDDLLPVARGEHAAQRERTASRIWRGQHRLHVRSRRRWNLVVAVDACDFLDKVFLDGDVEPVRGRCDGEVVAAANVRQAQTREDAGDHVGRNRDAEQLRHARAAQPHRSTRRQRSDRIAERSRAAAADFEDQLRCTLDGTRAELEVDATLEAVSGVALKAQSTHLALDHRRIPESAFEIDARRVVGNARVLAAHDSVQRAGRLVAVARAEFAIPQRQVTVTAQSRVEDLHVTGAVHRLDREVALLRLRREHADLDWQACWRIADQWHACRKLRLALHLASTWLGAKLPPNATQRVESDPIVCVLARDVLRRLQQLTDRGTSIFEYSRWRARSFDRTSDRVRYAWRTISAPRLEHLALLNVPLLPFSAYVPIRLVHDYVAIPVRDWGRRNSRRFRSRSQ